MDKQDIFTILDSLDVQISMGRIDQSTYDTLKQKWMQQLEQFTTHASEQTADALPGNGEHGQNIPGTPPAALVPSMHTSPAQPDRLATPATPATIERYKTEVLACPKCAAPTAIEAGQDLSLPIRCPFCETLYTLRQSQENAEQLKNELKAWLDQMIIGSGYNSSVDINARRFIFSELLYPALKKDIDRRLEAFENVLEAPLVQMKEANAFPDYQPAELLVTLSKGTNQWLKTLSTRVSAPALQDFAVVQDDKQKLQQLRMRVLSLIYYANIAQHQATPTSTSYQVVRQNIIALQKDYQSYAHGIMDEHYRSYLRVLNVRTSGNTLLLDLLIAHLEKKSLISAETLLVRANDVITQLENARQLALTCTYNPLYTVPLQQGIQKDLVVAKIFQTIATCYTVMARTRATEFKEFYKHIMQYVQDLAHIQSVEHLWWLLISVGRVQRARWDRPVPVIKDWSWLDTTLENHRRRSSFDNVNGQVLRHHFHPYWVASFSYSEISGKLVTKVSVRDGFLLVDATCTDLAIHTETPVIVTLPENHPAYASVQIGLQNYQLLDKQIVSLPVILTHEAAEKTVKAYIRDYKTTLKILTVQMIGVLYLPAASIRYTHKQKQREVIVSRLSDVDQDLERVLKRTQDFLSTYDA